MTRSRAEEYRIRYGATTGDRIRLGDTDLWVRVGEDRTARGDEPLWGYAKNLRSRMAQWDEAAGPSELDVVLTGALVIDPVIGVVKADIGIKDGRIAGIGRAGSPAMSDGIDLVVGPHTKSYMAYGLIATPGAVDTHVHTITPELLATRAVGRRHDVHDGRVRGAAVRDGARPRGDGGVADQHRHAGRARGRSTRGTSTRWSRRAPSGSRSTRTTARTRTSSTASCATRTSAT